MNGWENVTEMKDVVKCGRIRLYRFEKGKDGPEIKILTQFLNILHIDYQEIPIPINHFGFG